MNYGVEISEYKGKKIGFYGGKFLPLHKAHLHCIMQAQSMVDILFVVVGYDDEYDQELCRDSKIKWMSSRDRERIISEELKNLPNIRVFSAYEKRSDDYMNDNSIFASAQYVIDTCGGKIDVVFSSEREYDEYFNKYYPESEHIVLDADRTKFDISATKIRTEGVFKHWDMLPRATQQYFTKRIAICGIESAGKTHLLKMLSSYFNTVHVEEYGRIYYDELNSYIDVAKYEDYIDIAVGHCHLLNEAHKKANKILLSDTDLGYTQYFHARENNDELHDLINTMMINKADKIDTYIYIEPHNYHELDGTRRPVSDKRRQMLNKKLKSIYAAYGIQMHIVDEPDRLKRFNKCVDIIEGLL